MELLIQGAADVETRAYLSLRPLNWVAGKDFNISSHRMGMYIYIYSIMGFSPITGNLV